MFELTDQPIDAAVARAQLARPDAGAFVVFEGWVRNHHQGRTVLRLEYEAFDELARTEGAAIVAEAEEAHPGSSVLCIHRTGTLGIGQLAVWIGVTAPHRQAAFLATRQVIEEVKRRLPIWKKEHFTDAEPVWVNCTAEPSVNAVTATHYYTRQVALAEIGPAGQRRIESASVLVVGLGGLGCPAAQYLATSGVGQLTLVDSGSVEASNLHRQPLFTAGDVGVIKVTAAAARLKQQNPLIKIDALAVEVSAANVRALVTGRDVVLDCTDNFATRFLLHDACREAAVPLVQAAVDRFEGELNVFAAGQPGCLHCLWSGRKAADLLSVDSCADGAVFAPAVGVLGIMQASEALKLILGQTETTRSSATRLVNLLDCSVQALVRPVDPACPVCGTSDSTVPLRIPTASGFDNVMITAEALAALGPSQAVYLLEAGERVPSATPMAGEITLPIGNLVELRAVASRGPTVLRCRRGQRSAALARLLRTEGWPRVYAWSAG